MGVYASVLKYSIGNIFIGIIVTIIGLVLMFLLIKGWYKNATMSVVAYVVAVILVFFLSFHSTLICGAFTIKSYSDKVERLINSTVASLPTNQILDQDESQQILETISVGYPLVGYFLNYADFSGHTPQNIAKSMNDTMQTYMNWYILRRLGWVLLFVVVGAFIVIKTMHKINSKDRHRHSTQRGRVSSSNSSRRHYHTSRR